MQFVNFFPAISGLGVAVALDKATPLMRMFKNKNRQVPDLAEAAAFAERLGAIANRGRIDIPAFEAPEEPTAPVDPRLFWTPDEVAAGSGHA